MNKQEQKRKLSQVICGNCDGNARTLCSCPQVSRILQAGYINGADFVEWLKTRLKQEQGNASNVPSHAWDICKGLQRAIDIIDEALQEYLKGE